MTGAVRQFYKTFIPKPGEDYSWLLAAAKWRYDQVDKAVEYIDTKAAAVINYFGTGVGVLTFTAAAGAGTGAVSATVAGWAVPAFAVGTASVAVAALVRRPSELQPGPSATFGAKLIDRYEDFAVVDGVDSTKAIKQAEYATAGLWEMASDANTDVLARKADLLTWAVWLKAAAIGLLLLPLIAAVVEKWNKPAPPPAPEYITPSK